jgi:hypothetical protein
VTSFFDVTDPVDVLFQIKYADQLVVVPKGGNRGNVVVTVVPK